MMLDVHCQSSFVFSWLYMLRLNVHCWEQSESIVYYNKIGKSNFMMMKNVWNKVWKVLVMMSIWNLNKMWIKNSFGQKRTIHCPAQWPRRKILETKENMTSLSRRSRYQAFSRSLWWCARRKNAMKMRTWRADVVFSQTPCANSTITEQSPSWNRGVPMASRRGHISLALFYSLCVLPMRPCHCFNTRAVSTQALCRVLLNSTAIFPRNIMHVSTDCRMKARGVRIQQNCVLPTRFYSQHGFTPLSIHSISVTFRPSLEFFTLPNQPFLKRKKIL